MVWQSLRASVWALLTSPVKLSIAIYKLFGFLVKATLYFLIFSIASCLFIYAFAATDSNGVEVPDSVPAQYIPKKYIDSPVACSVAYGTMGSFGVSGCVDAIQSFKKYIACKDSEDRWITCPLVFSSFVTQPNFVPGTAYSGQAIYCPSGGRAVCETLPYSYSGDQAVYTEQYICPPSGYPQHTISDGVNCLIKFCPKNQARTFDGVDMENGAGYACNAGCETNVLKPTTSKGQFGWQFIGVTTGSVCKCVDSSGNPSGSLNCWYRGYSPDGSGSGTDKTCSAYDQGEVKGVNCGENGSMQVDLGPINDSLVGLSQANQAQDKTLNEHSVQLGNHEISLNNIKGRMDSGEFKGEKGDIGETGPAGQKGDTGEQGINGARGQDGAQGEKGDIGETGATGATGAQGEKGEAGADGENGEDGAAGATGAQGAQGIQGIQGVAGVAGAAGRDGIDGKDGEDGEDGEGLTAVQDGIDVNIMSASTGARLATLKGIDRDGIVTELEQSNSTLSDINDKLEDLTAPTAPTEVNADYGDKFAIKDPARTYSSVLSEHVTQMKATQMFQAMSGFFSVSFNGDCSPINFNFTVYSQAFDISIDPFCNLTIWPYIRAVVMCVFGFFAFRVGFDN